MTGQCDVFFERFNQFGVYAHVILSPSREEELAKQLDYDNWPSLYGNWPPPQGQFEGSDLALTDRQGTVLCQRACDSSGAEEVHSIWLRYNDLLKSLEDGSERVEGDLLLKVVDATLNYPPNYPIATWPASQDIADFYLPQDVASDAPPFRLSGGTDANALRDLRDDFESGRYGPWTSEEFPIGTAGATKPSFLLFLSDIMPFENESGMIVVR